MANTMRESDVIYLTCDMSAGQTMREVEYQIKRMLHLTPRIIFCDIIYPIGKTPEANYLAQRIHKRLRNVYPNLPADNYAIYLNIDVTHKLQARDAMTDRMDKRGVKTVNLKRANNYDKNALADETTSSYLIT